MKTRKEVISFCKTLEGTYEDYPFNDFNWTVMRHKDNKKMYAAIYEREGGIWVNVKCDPSLAYMWRGAFESVIPAYHMNKTHWNSIILNGTIPCNEIKTMIADSYILTKSVRSRKK